MLSDLLIILFLKKIGEIGEKIELHENQVQWADKWTEMIIRRLNRFRPAPVSDVFPQRIIRSKEKNVQQQKNQHKIHSTRKLLIGRGAVKSRVQLMRFPFSLDFHSKTPPTPQTSTIFRIFFLFNYLIFVIYLNLI